MPAIIPIAFGVGGLLAGSALSKNKKPLSAPAPTAAATPAPAATPPTTTAAAAGGAFAGVLAAARQRKRAQAGTGVVKPSTSSVIGAVAQPAALIGRGVLGY